MMLLHGNMEFQKFLTSIQQKKKKKKKHAITVYQANDPMDLGIFEVPRANQLLIDPHKTSNPSPDFFISRNVDTISSSTRSQTRARRRALRSLQDTPAISSSDEEGVNFLSPCIPSGVALIIKMPGVSSTWLPDRLEGNISMRQVSSEDGWDVEE